MGLQQRSPVIRTRSTTNIEDASASVTAGIPLGSWYSLNDCTCRAACNPCHLNDSSGESQSSVWDNTAWSNDSCEQIMLFSSSSAHTWKRIRTMILLDWPHIASARRMLPLHVAGPYIWKDVREFRKLLETPKAQETYTEPITSM